MKYGWISHLQKYSLHDGPGIRTTVFLKGCPLDCWWCHNPENRSPNPEILVVESRCIRCGECVEVCPQTVGQASSLPSLPNSNDGAARRDELHCTLCGACIEACPAGARQLVGQRWSVDQTLHEILKDSIFYDDSQGGVTFSGGEPLMQPQFLAALLAACRDHGIHTAVDTCGYGPQETLLDLSPLTHLFLYDLKVMDEAKHLQYTGVSNRPILDNLKALAHLHSNIWIRIPIIPGLNDTEADLEAMAELVISLPNLRQVHLLPYHQTGIAKFKRLGQVYRLPGLKPPTTEYMAGVADRLYSLGLKVKCGG